MFKKFDKWIKNNPGEFLTIFFASLIFFLLFLLMLFVAGDALLNKR